MRTGVRAVLGALVRGAGQLLITAGYVVLLFAVYEVWISDLLTGQVQEELTSDLRERWSSAPALSEPAQSDAATVRPVGPVDEGAAFALLHIPRLGSNWARAVVEGTGSAELKQGPGHYVGTAMPGAAGNFALAGHRVGRGSPFQEIDTLRPGDPIVVETPDAWYVYRVLGDRTHGDLQADPTGIPGMQVVAPSDLDVISPTPTAGPGAPATGAYLTLTTCHPEYSARQRLVVHAALDGAPVAKSQSPAGPSALRES